MRIPLIFNPSAGDDKQPTVSQIEALIGEAGYKTSVYSIKEKGWQRALTRKAEFVVVAGGDGTVGKVARQLIGSGIPIAILPLGTANNVSKTLGIADLPITQLIPAWKSAKRLTFDTGIAVGPWGEQAFIEGFGTGLLTSSIPEIDNNKTLAQLPDKHVKVAYAQQIMREHLEDCDVIDIEATLDGVDISGRYVLFEVLNMQYVGPNLFLAPEVERNNGELDVVLVSEQHRKKLHDRITKWQEGKLHPPEIVTHRGRHLEINWTGFRVHIDDKLWPSKTGKRPKPPAPIAIDVRSESIEFMVPAEVHEMQRLTQR